MPPTNPSWPPASTAASSPPDLPPPGGICAIHQPNFFPRLTTLAKLFAADHWIVLDDVQFTRRDYQHRARLALPDNPEQGRWLTIPTHLPNGRPTLIRDAVMVEPDRSRRRAAHMLRQYYGSSRYWPTVWPAVEPALALFGVSDRLSLMTEATTLALLHLLGWRGRVLRSSQLPARPGRSQRLADLASRTGARSYLCGTGGARYLDRSHFATHDVSVEFFRAPSDTRWTRASEVSALWALTRIGPKGLAEQVSDIAAAHRT